MNEHDASELIFTADPESDRYAWHELQQADRPVDLLDWLAPGVGRVSLGSGWLHLLAQLDQRPPIFVRHLCPVHAGLQLRGQREDLERLAQAAAPLVALADPALPFSVQTRLLDTTVPYGRFNVNEGLAALLAERGAPLDVRRPEQVLSVVCTRTRGYLGLSRPEQNLSDWAGGERRFQRESGQISRSEFKLLEALDVYGIELPTGGTALDLGAAPGGWTRILRSHALTVVAVDPADLHPLLADDPAVTHIRGLAHDYLTGPGANRQFDVILNDMRMDARDSARLMVSAANRLAPDGVAIVTLKLPARHMDQVAAAALNLLRRRYRLLGARQLFHNRREITAVLTSF